MNDDTPANHDIPANHGPPARAPLPDGWWNLPLRTRRLIAGGVAVGVIALVGLIWVAVFDDGDEGPDPVAFVAALSPDRLAQWDRLAQCESEGQWDLDTDNGYFGGLQFSLGSWEEVDGSGSPAATSREEQIMRAEFLFDLQGWSAWPRCSARLELS